MCCQLRELIDRIEVFAVAFANKEDDEVADYIQEVVAEVAPEKLKDKEFWAFVRHVTERRMSKEARFLRIHFKSGARRDVVPEGSIASGRGLEVDEDGQVGWRIVRPDIEKLRQEFLSKTGGKEE